MKVAIGTWEALPAMGGPAYYIDELVKRLAEKIDVTLIVPSYASIQDRGKLVTRKIGSIDVPVVRVYMFAVRASLLVRKLDFDIIHDNGVLGFCNMVPFIETWHHTNLDNRTFLSTSAYYLSLYRELLTLRGIKKSNSIIAVSEAAKRELMDLYSVPSSKIFIAPHGVDVDFFRPLDSSEIHTFSKKDGQIILLYVGSLSERKNIASLIKAIKTLNKTHKNLYLLIVGDGPEKKQLEELVNNLGLVSHVSFLGGISREHLREVYNIADYVVLPSFKEGFGMTILEALACNKPVIMSPVGISEIIKSNQLGVVADGFSSTNIALAIESALTTDFKNLRQYVQTNYSWSKTIEITLQVYNETLKLFDR